MRKTALLLASMASALSMALFDKASRALDGPSLKRIVLILFLCLAVSSGSSTPLWEAEAAPKPNILFVLVDDAHVSMLGRTPRIEAELVERGTTYANTFSNYPLCCPGRAALLTGQYAHNHGVVQNNGSPFFGANSGEGSALPTWLDAAGYRTALFGKYLNGYEGERIPPGWERWYAFNDGRGMGWLSVNDQGDTYRQEPHMADTNVKNKALTFLQQTPERRPFFAWVSFGAPHAPYYYAPSDRDSFRGVRVPRTPAFNEADVSDKGSFVGSQPSLTPEEVLELDRNYRDGLRGLMRVDRFVGTAVDTLRKRGLLDETYIVFYSDNGNHFGEHRLRVGKQTPYETDINFPFVVRGPDVRRGAVSNALLANHDFAPTVADLAGARSNIPVDGRSFAPLLTNPGTSEWTRKRVLIEKPIGSPGKPPAWNAVRSLHSTYVEYDSGEKELYDLAADPYQLKNVYKDADHALKKALATRLEALRSCAGQACKAAEDGQAP